MPVAVVLFAALACLPGRWTAFRPGEVTVGGEIGRRLEVTADRMLHHIDFENAFAKHFRTRKEKPDVWGGFAGYGMVLDAVVKAAAQVYDVIGPDGGQVFVTVDGERKGPYSRFDAYCWYHRPQVLYVGCMESGIHDVVIEVAETQPDRTIVGKKDEDVKSAKYDGTVFRPGAILLRGEIVND